MSGIVSALNPTNWIGQINTKNDSKAVNVASRVAVGLLGAKSALDGINTVKDVKSTCSKNNWQVKQIATATAQFACAFFALRASLS